MKIWIYDYNLQWTEKEDDSNCNLDWTEDWGKRRVRGGEKVRIKKMSAAICISGVLSLALSNRETYYEFSLVVMPLWLVGFNLLALLFISETILECFIVGGIIRLWEASSQPSLAWALINIELSEWVSIPSRSRRCVMLDLNVKPINLDTRF